MSKPVSNLRLFVGIYPPSPEVVEGFMAALKNLELPPHRLVPLDQVHLTILFIGDVSSRELGRTIESVAHSASGLESFSLRPQRFISLPQRGRARLMAVETDGPAPLLELQRRLVTRLAKNPRHRPGDRFRPHMTLCRFQNPAKLEQIERLLKMDDFDVSDLRLMRSTLRPEGAVHHELERFELRA